MSLSLDGRVALVTGASKGIGFAVAQALLENGAKVAGIGRDDVALKTAAEKLGENFLPVTADVTSDESVAAAVDAVVGWGGKLDILVNSAGPQLMPSELVATPSATIENYLAVKLLGFHRVATAAVPRLTTGGVGRIINIAGQTATTFVPNAGVTALANAGVLAFSKYLAAELAPQGILVNAISPGLTLTEGWLGKHDAMATAQGKTADEVRAGMVAGAGIKIGRWAEPAEIAQSVVFLASDAATYLSGAVIEVDGGMSKSIV